MIPILIISKDSKLVKKYLDNLKADNFFFEILPSTKEFSIEDIKSLIKDTKIFNPKIRVYFLNNFNLSSIPAQNSFLKLLEDPPSKIQFVLSANDRNSLLPTIISRVKIVKLQADILQKVVVDNFVKSTIEELINKPSATKIPFLQYKTADASSANDILNQIIIYFQKKLSLDKKSARVIKKMLTLIKLLYSNNLNPQLTIDEALIFIWKTYRMK